MNSVEKPQTHFYLKKMKSVRDHKPTARVGLFLRIVLSLQGLSLQRPLHHWQGKRKEEVIAGN